MISRLLNLVWHWNGPARCTSPISASTPTTTPLLLFDRSDINHVGRAFVVFVAADPRKAVDMLTCTLRGTLVTVYRSASNFAQPRSALDLATPCWWLAPAKTS